MRIRLKQVIFGLCLCLVFFSCGTAYGADGDCLTLAADISAVDHYVLGDGVSLTLEAQLPQGGCYSFFAVEVAYDPTILEFVGSQLPEGYSCNLDELNGKLRILYSAAAAGGVSLLFDSGVSVIGQLLFTVVGEERTPVCLQGEAAVAGGSQASVTFAEETVYVPIGSIFQIEKVVDDRVYLSVKGYGTAGYLVLVASYADTGRMLDVKSGAAVTELGGLNTKGAAYVRAFLLKADDWSPLAKASQILLTP